MRPATDLARPELVNVTGAPVRVWGPFGVRVLKPGEALVFNARERARCEGAERCIAGFRLEPARA